MEYGGYSVKDGNVTHSMNGTEVVKYTLWTPSGISLWKTASSKTFRVSPKEFQRKVYRTSGSRICRVVQKYQNQGTLVVKISEFSKTPLL